MCSFQVGVYSLVTVVAPVLFLAVVEINSFPFFKKGATSSLRNDKRILQCPKLSYRPESGGRKQIGWVYFNWQFQAKSIKKKGKKIPHPSPVHWRLAIKATSCSAFRTNQPSSSMNFSLWTISYSQAISCFQLLYSQLGFCVSRTFTNWTICSAPVFLLLASICAYQETLRFRDPCVWWVGLTENFLLEQGHHAARRDWSHSLAGMSHLHLGCLYLPQDSYEFVLAHNHKFT